MPRLGLGAAINSPKSDPVNAQELAGPELGRIEVAATDVKAPADMIAIGDTTRSVISPNYGDYYMDALHNGGANVAFCDGHVEYAKESKWVEATDSARKRWNNDNQPHPETWKKEVGL